MIKPKIALMLSLSAMMLLTGYVGAASRAEIKKLDAAFPVGSKIYCQSDLSDGIYEHNPMKLVMQGTVIESQAERTQYDIRVEWIPDGAKRAQLSLHYHMTNTRETDGVRMYTDPASLKASMPGSHMSEQEITDQVLARFALAEHFQSDHEVEITDFPAYVIRRANEAPLYCRKAG